MYMYIYIYIYVNTYLYKQRLMLAVPPYRHTMCQCVASRWEEVGASD